MRHVACPRRRLLGPVRYRCALGATAQGKEVTWTALNGLAEHWHCPRRNLKTFRSVPTRVVRPCPFGKLCVGRAAFRRWRSWRLEPARVRCVRADLSLVSLRMPDRHLVQKMGPYIIEDRHIADKRARPRVHPQVLVAAVTSDGTGSPWPTLWGHFGMPCHSILLCTPRSDIASGGFRSIPRISR